MRRSCFVPRGVRGLVCLVLMASAMLHVCGCGDDEATPPPSAELADLTISAGTLSPAFTSGETFYTVDVARSVATLTVTPTALDSGATVTVNGDVVASGTPSASIDLAMGTNTITLVVTATDGVTLEGYTLLVSRGGQRAYLKASNTGIDDRFGTAIAVDGDTIVVGVAQEDSDATGVDGDQTDNTAGASGAVYVFTRSGGVWSQQAYLKASNAEASDSFGGSVAVSGDTVVVGARGEDSDATGVDGDQTNNNSLGSGAAYVFTRSGNVWSQQAYLKASNAEASDSFGQFIAVDGDTIIVAARLEDSSAIGVNSGGQADNSASASGAAYIFTRSGVDWSQQAYLKASNTENADRFGSSVAVDGDTVVVGAYGEDSNATGVDGDHTDNSASASGAAYVFTRSGSVWSQEAYLKASNTDVDDVFGYTVAVDGDTVVVGSYREDSGATGVNSGGQTDNSVSDSGAAYIFARTGVVWSQQTYLKASNTDADDFFGFPVAVDGDTVVVGATYEGSNATGVNGDQTDNSAVDAGAVYVFE